MIEERPGWPRAYFAADIGAGGQSMPSIVCVGTVSVDTIVVTPRAPSEDGRVEASSLTVAGGGNAANAAVAIARLGLEVDFCGTVGDDAAGEQAIELLMREGVSTDLIVRDPSRPTAQSIITVSELTAARSIVALTAPAPPKVPKGFDWVHLDKAGYGALEGERPGSSLVSLDDGNIVPSLSLALIDLYVPTALVLAERFPIGDPVQSARAVQAAGTAMVVGTAGSAGSFGVDQGGSVSFAPALDIRPRSTLGAGDVFHGALVAALVLEKSLEEALRFANVVAALSCRGIDGRSGIPDRAETEAALAELAESNLNEQEIASRFAARVND